MNNLAIKVVFVLFLTFNYIFDRLRGTIIIHGMLLVILAQMHFLIKITGQTPALTVKCRVGGVQNYLVSYSHDRFVANGC